MAERPDTFIRAPHDVSRHTAEVLAMSTAWRKITCPTPACNNKVLAEALPGSVVRKRCPVCKRYVIEIVPE